MVFIICTQIAYHLNKIIAIFNFLAMWTQNMYVQPHKIFATANTFDGDFKILFRIYSLTIR